MNPILENKTRELADLGLDPGYINGVIRFVEKGQDAHLYRINPMLLAQHNELDPEKLLEVFFYGTRVGLFDLNWEVFCPQCEGVTDTCSHLSRMSSQSFCAMCDMDFEVEFDGTVEVTFTVNENIKPIRVPDKPLMAYEAGPLRLTGLDCAANKTFNELFSSQVISITESIRVRDMAVMFTDLTASTAMYHNLGDPQAYHLVRSHFDVIDNIVDSHRGAPVKTIGDEVMSIFTRPPEALRAAVEVQRELARINSGENIPTRLELKIAVNHGPCLAVNLNDRLDYFGNMVNVAARIRALAEPRDIIITDAMYSDERVKQSLNGMGAKVKPYKAKLKGLPGTNKIYKVKY